MKWYEEDHRRVSLIVIEYSICVQSGHTLVPVLCLVLAGEHGGWLPQLVDELHLGGVTNL